MHKLQDFGLFLSNGMIVLLNDWNEIYWMEDPQISPDDLDNILIMLEAPENGSISSFWYIYGVPHRIDGPAVISNDGNKLWWREHGELHREDGPAYVDKSTGVGVWYENGYAVPPIEPRMIG